MTHPVEPDRPDDSNRPDTDVDAVFEDLVSSMPDLASIQGLRPRPDFELVHIVVPHPSGNESTRLTLEVPTELAPMVRAEFGPDRVAAMVRAMAAFATLSVPPRP